MSGLTSFHNERETVKVMTAEYNVEEDGHRRPEPIVQLFCRSTDGRRRYVEVEGFYPYFYLSAEEFQNKQDDILNDHAVRRVEVSETVSLTRDNESKVMVDIVENPPAKTLHDEELVKVYTITPKDVGEIREQFDETWEADVFFTNRFFVTTGIKRGLTVPSGEERVHVDDIEPTEDVPDDLHPRVLTVDIEVYSGSSFPDTEATTKPIIAYTLHDNYDNEYYAAILRPGQTDYADRADWKRREEWRLPDGVDAADVSIEVFDSEAKMLDAGNEWIVDKDPDLLTGWNSSRNDIGNGFDWPYWINRCKTVNAWGFTELSPVNQTFVTRSGTPVVKGREMFDMLQAYKKTQIHEKRSYALDYIANEELDTGKEDVDDLDEAWLTNPVEFLKYNIRDVSAVVGIEASKGVLDMYDHIRHVTGTSYSECADSNIDIIDMLFLRAAQQRGYALPTSTKPDVQHYWGAWVKDPVAGKHENVVYPDLASLYPANLIDMNMSPETIIGDSDDLDASEYTEDDCHVVYVDPRTEDEKRDADDPEREEMYVLKPSVQESFIREVVEEMVEFKYKFKSDDYGDEAYSAAKRVTNCFAEDTDVLTPDGLVNITNVSVGDEVYSIDPDTHQLVTKTVVETHEYPNYDGGLLHVQNQSTDFVVTPNHNMLTNDGGTYSFTEARNLLSHNKFANEWEWCGEGIVVPDTLSDVFEDPCSYVEFIGAYVAEGSCCTNTINGEEYKVAQLSQHTNVNNIERILSSCNADFSDGPNYRTYNSSLVEHLSDLGTSENKHFPFDVSDLSTTQAKNLQDILLHTDGHDGYYYTKSEKLAQQVAEVTLICGTTPNIRKREDGIYYVNLGKSSQNYVSNSSIETTTNDVGVYCVTVKDTHTLLAGRNGKLQFVGQSVYGVLGDSKSFGSGFRLFDWRIAEAITLGGRDIIKHTADAFEDEVQSREYDDASIIAGDTDSAVCTIPSADGLEETLDVSMDAADAVNSTYDEFMKERFNIDEHRQEVEVESYAESAMFMDKKKRYAQRIRWDEGDYVDEVEYKGFELVRSDSAEITGEVQRGVIDRILKRDNPESAVRSYLKDEWQAAVNGDVSLDEIGVPSKVNDALDEYGGPDKNGDYYTPQPHIRGAKYATAHIDGENITSGDKPMLYYVDRVGYPYPDVYVYQDDWSRSTDDVPNDPTQVELGQSVDAIALNDVSNMPDTIGVDYERMADKTIRGPVEPIVETMGWTFDDLTTGGSQESLADFM